jgi:hypothetical protein
MMALLTLLVLGGDATGSGCAAPVAPRASLPDPVSAEVYRRVGDDEAAAGNVVAAEAAYRQALARNPGDERARASLARLCAAEGAPASAAPPDRFQQGIERMNRGDRQGAIAEFEAVRAAGPDPAAALLEGICAYELGDDERARPLFEEARSTPKVAGTAKFFLGLIALRDDDTARAASLFEAAAASDERLAASAAGLGRLAHRDGRLVVSAFVEGGYDSNVPLAPDGTATDTGDGDGDIAAVVGMFWRPWGTTGPYAHLVGQYRKQFQITSYDLGEVSGALGYRVGRGGQYVAGEYSYDFLALGGAPYLSANRLLATGRLVHGHLSAGATYLARWESYLTTAASPYSGLNQDGEIEGDWQAWTTAALGVGYHLGRDITTESALSFLEHGPFAVLRLGLAGDTRLFAEELLTFRRYDVFDLDLGVQRADSYFDGLLVGERDLSDHWTARLTLTARRALSNVPELQYTKVTAALGLAYTGTLL